jgi:hypothetical protein
MKELPYDCICTKSRHERLAKYLSQAEKELKLVQFIIDGYKPQVSVMLIREYAEKNRKVDTLVYDACVEKIDDFFYKISVGNIPIPEDTTVIVILLDTNSEPLYRHKFFADKKSTLDVDWKIGIMHAQGGKR